MRHSSHMETPLTHVAIDELHEKNENAAPVKCWLRSAENDVGAIVNSDVTARHATLITFGGNLYAWRGDEVIPTHGHVRIFVRIVPVKLVNFGSEVE